MKIYTIDRDYYKIFKENKDKCDEAEEKLLFHGTQVKFIASILKTFVDIERNASTKLGKGFYFQIYSKYHGDIEDQMMMMLMIKYQKLVILFLF